MSDLYDTDVDPETARWVMTGIVLARRYWLPGHC